AAHHTSSSRFISRTYTRIPRTYTFSNKYNAPVLFPGPNNPPPRFNMASSSSAGSEKITAKDMIAVAKVNWEKLATRAGFKDGAMARAH
ncbi:hypothetical protein F5Y08DRAFT_130899, partial [Xylaria arbuscula]